MGLVQQRDRQRGFWPFLAQKAGKEAGEPGIVYSKKINKFFVTSNITTYTWSIKYKQNNYSVYFAKNKKLELKQGPSQGRFPAHDACIPEAPRVAAYTTHLLLFPATFPSLQNKLKKDPAESSSAAQKEGKRLFYLFFYIYFILFYKRIPLSVYGRSRESLP